MADQPIEELGQFRYTMTKNVVKQLSWQLPHPMVTVPQKRADESCVTKVVGKMTFEMYRFCAQESLLHQPAHFQHLFAGSGYAAGYYAYLWAETLDADGFAAFAEAGNVFDPGLAARLKDIYAAGDTRDPMELYVAFRGRAPRIEAVLKDRGLVADAAQSGG